MYNIGVVGKYLCIGFCGFSLLYFYLRVLGLRRKAKVNKSNKVMDRFYKNTDYTNMFAAVDETPCYLEIGDEDKRYYLARPIKYKNFAGLMVVFKEAIDRLKKAENITIDTIIDNCSDEILEVLSLIVANFDPQQAEREKIYIQSNITNNQLIRAINLVIMQNDFSVFLSSIDRLKKNDKVAETET